jgi:hypothetical protein
MRTKIPKIMFAKLGQHVDAKFARDLFRSWFSLRVVFSVFNLILSDVQLLQNEVSFLNP